jgi:hypothetical protein
MRTERRGQVRPDSHVQYLNNSGLGQNLNLTSGQTELVTQLFFKYPEGPAHCNISLKGDTVRNDEVG